MENIQRIDDRITSQDFLDRMPSKAVGGPPVVRFLSSTACGV